MHVSHTHASSTPTGLETDTDVRGCVPSIVSVHDLNLCPQQRREALVSIQVQPVANTRSQNRHPAPSGRGISALRRPRRGCGSGVGWVGKGRKTTAPRRPSPHLHCSRCLSDNLHDVGSGGDVGEVPVLSLQLLGQPGGGNESGYHPSKQNLHRTLGLALFRPRALRTLESESSSSHRCTSSLQPFSLQMDSSI